MKILHSSDLHGSYHRLLDALTQDFDIWVDTGDFFPNKTRGRRDIEIPYQTRWFRGYKGLGERIRIRLGDRPVLCVQGNHDFINLASLLRASGVNATDAREGTVIQGLKFWGFGEIPWIEGEWNGEITDFHPLLQSLSREAPDILLTHAPPGGILSDQWGISALSSFLFYQPHSIRLHLFGHVHEHGGEEMTEAGIRFVNGATRIKVLE